jgi:hypothetical protein
MRRVNKVTIASVSLAVSKAAWCSCYAPWHVFRKTLIYWLKARCRKQACKLSSFALSSHVAGDHLLSNRVYAKLFHVLRFTVSKPRKVSTKKKCMRDFRFTAPYVIEAHFSLKLYWYYQDYPINHRYWTFFHRAFVNCNKNCNFLVIISYFSLVLLLAMYS